MPDIGASPDHLRTPSARRARPRRTPACTVTSSPRASRCPRVRTSTTTPGQPSSATTRLLPAADDEHGLAGVVGRADRLDQFVGRRRDHDTRGRTAQAQRGQLGKQRLRHESSASTARRYPGASRPAPSRRRASTRARVARRAARPTRIGCGGWTTGSPRRSARTCGRPAIRSSSTSVTAPRRSPPSSSRRGWPGCGRTSASSASSSTRSGSTRRSQRPIRRA